MRIVDWGAALAIAASLQPTTVGAAPAPTASAGVQNLTTMPEGRFWSLIKQSVIDDREKQIELLRENLSKLSPDDIVAFEAMFDELMKRSYRWDLWGAAYVAMGGASDDGFEYFRLWLISRGKDALNRVLADPDELAEIALDEPELLEFGDLAYVASDVWSSETGKPRDEKPRLSVFLAPAGYGAPAGHEFSEEPESLAQLYPKLWRRFGAGRAQ